MNRRVRTAAQTAVLMAILTLISKLFGFIREMIMANYFGTSFIVDAYTMSFTILTVLFGGMITAISIAYMPIYSKITEDEGKQAGDQFTSRVMNLLLVLSIVISILGILLSDQIITVLASGFTGETAALASFYVKILFSYVVFSSSTGILESYLQYKGIFLPQIIVGYLISACTIVVIIISAYTSYRYLAFGVLAGYAFRFITITVIAKRKGLKYTPILKFNMTFREIIPVAVPAFLGSYVLYINQFIDKTIASWLVEGSIAALNYAWLLNNMIMGVTITVLSTIIYPKLTQANSLEQYDRFNDIVGTGLNVVVIIALPCSLGSMIYSSQAVQIVYERGAFDTVATAMTSSAFFFYSIGLLFMSVNDLLTRIFYSMRDMKTPMIFAGVGVIINVILNLILVQFMKHNGLALATSISSLCNTVFLSYFVKIKYPKVRLLDSINKLVKIMISAFIAIGVSYLLFVQVIVPLIYIRVVQLGIAVLLAGAVYLVMLSVFKISELRLLSSIIKKQ